MMRFHTAIWIILLLSILALDGISAPAELCDEDADYRIRIEEAVDTYTNTGAADKDVKSDNSGASRDEDIGYEFDIATTKGIILQIDTNNSSVSTGNEKIEEIPLVRDPGFWTSLFSLIVIVIGGTYVFFNFPLLHGGQASRGKPKGTTMPGENVVQKGTTPANKDADSVDDADIDKELDLPHLRPFYGRLAKSFPHDRPQYVPQKKLKIPQNIPISGRTKEVKALPPHEPTPDEKTPHPEDIDPAEDAIVYAEPAPPHPGE